MNDCMTFPDTVEEFMEQYKVVDTEHIYTNGSEFVPIFRMKQWFEHLSSAQPDTTTHDSIPAETGENDEDRTSGDCISRQAAIDALKEKVFHNLSDEFYGAMQVLDELPSVQPEQRWIPCSERLPNKFEDVWVTDNRGRVAVCRMGHTGWRDMESDEWMYCLDSIVAWMPYYVPEPYQEGEH